MLDSEGETTASPLTYPGTELGVSLWMKRGVRASSKVQRAGLHLFDLLHENLEAVCKNTTKRVWRAGCGERAELLRVASETEQARRFDCRFGEGEGWRQIPHFWFGKERKGWLCPGSPCWHCGVTNWTRHSLVSSRIPSDLKLRKVMFE